MTASRAAPDADFRKRTLAALKWSIGGHFANQVIAFTSSVMLARLLSPREFGLMAMITVLTGFMGLFADLGFGAAIVQRSKVDEVHLSSVFWLNVAGGAGLALLIFLAAPAIAAFYAEPLLSPVTRLVSLTFFIRSFNIVQQNLLNRALDFKSRAVVDSIATLVSSAAAIVLAFKGFHVYSLAGQALIASIISALVLWLISDWRPRFLFDRRAVSELLGFSLNLLGTNSLQYWGRNVDNLLVGKVLGSAQLGVYSRAYAVMMFPLQNVSKVVGRVMFPSLSRIQEDRARVARVYLRATRVIALVTFPLCVGVSVTAEPFVLTLFGARWIEVVPVLQVLSLVGLVQSIGTMNGNLYLSQGRADLQFRLNLFTKLTTLTGIVAGLSFGTTGVALGYAAATLIATGPAFHFAGGLVGLRWRDQIRNLGGIAMSTLVMSVAVILLSTLLQGVPPILELGLEAAVGAVIFIGLIVGFKQPAWLDLMSLYRERRAARQPALVPPR